MSGAEFVWNGEEQPLESHAFYARLKLESSLWEEGIQSRILALRADVEALARRLRWLEGRHSDAESEG